MNDINRQQQYIDTICARINAEGHAEGEEVLCPDCGKPKSVWSRVDKSNNLFPCFRECDCSKQSQIAEEANRLKQKKTASRIYSQLPKRYEGYTFDAWEGDKREAYTMGIRYCENAKDCIGKGLGFTLSGDVRIGKTYLLSCVFNRLSDDGWRVFYANHSEILSDLRPSSSGKNANGELMRHLEQAQVVILDDIGTETLTEWGISRTYDIVDYLYRNNTPFLCGTNLSSDQLDAYFRNEDGVNRVTPRILESSPLVALESSDRSGTAQDNAYKHISALIEKTNNSTASRA